MMIHTNRAAACELAGDALLTYLDRLPSSERNQVRGLAEFLKSIGGLRQHNGRINEQARVISLTVDVED